MVKIIAHRINKINQLKDVSKHFGIEADVRDFKNKIILSHDPHKSGEELKHFIKQTKKTIFLNIKSSGLIDKILPLLKKKKVYFLDLSFSEIYYLITKNLSKNIILRYSILERFDLKNKYYKKIEWIWYDYFDYKKITKKDYLYFKKFKKKICIVSPELLGQSESDVLNYINFLNKNKIKIEAVCTKTHYDSLWINYYNY